MTRHLCAQPLQEGGNFSRHRPLTCKPGIKHLSSGPVWYTSNARPTPSIFSSGLSKHLALQMRSQTSKRPLALSNPLHLARRRHLGAGDTLPEALVCRKSNVTSASKTLNSRRVLLSSGAMFGPCPCSTTSTTAITSTGISIIRSGTRHHDLQTSSALDVPFPPSSRPRLLPICSDCTCTSEGFRSSGCRLEIRLHGLRISSVTSSPEAGTKRIGIMTDSFAKVRIS